MPARSDRMRLGAFLYPGGHHVAAWRHPSAQADAGVNAAHYRRIARTAEAAKFDLIFLADGVAVRGEDIDALSRTAIRYVGQFEPLTLLSHLAAVTERIGLVATASTTYNEPFHVARKFASLDHLSEGRAGWNLVTSADPREAWNFSRESHLAHAHRYTRAEEFVDVVRGLWDSYADDAFVRDRESGRFFDPDRLHLLAHEGAHFSVRGPLNVPRPPQGHPVVVQAGSSEAGKALAARTAEIVFTAQTSLEDATAFYADVKGRMAGFGRDPDHLKIMPGAFPVVGRTESEAQDRYGELQDLIHPVVGRSLLEQLAGADLSAYPDDALVPDLPETEGGKSRQALMLTLARREKLTIRELYLRIAGARGHWTLVGTPSRIADALQERFEAHGADGFNIMPPTLPGGLDDFATLVIPELQRRGLFRRDYEGRTLRENLGLPRPPHRHPAAAIRAPAAP
ncbi:LLM class flavin-dependent oxidoreductase [Methylobacterium goesingense]|uniref:FMN-dependent oxidoreductase (Nitrilotriacetate monooxygenase family) n=1 Tax=Methylobacterium goesingense TaxID=243690 RepID=A0ABV2L2B8_9HYPH|nr:LLM class flavin-dependent oxidoreductase [Methylobacterium goesingense]GJD75340.1 Nitrilotriacetate monooxygenase component A [Methylobacterium goesingense]